MKKLLLLTTTSVLLLAGCGKPGSAPTSSIPHQTSTNSNANADPAKTEPKLNDDGTLVLPDETRKAMSLTTIQVVSKTFTSPHGVTFQIFREADEKPLSGLMYRSGFAYGLALLKDDKDDFTIGQTATAPIGANATKYRKAKVVGVDRLPEGSDFSWEIVLEIEDPSNQMELGKSCVVAFPSSAMRTGLVIPKSAALKASDGTYAYLQTPDGFKRAGIKTGVMTGDDVEVTEGLKAGDFVVSSPVQMVWLTELQLRGGDRG